MTWVKILDETQCLEKLSQANPWHCISNNNNDIKAKVILEKITYKF